VAFFYAQCYSPGDDHPLEWKYEHQVGRLVSTIAGAGFGIVISCQSGDGWLGTLFGRSSALSFSAERFILIGSFVSAHALPSPLPAALVFRRLGSLLYDRNLESHS